MGSGAGRLENIHKQLEDMKSRAEKMEQTQQESRAEVQQQLEDMNAKAERTQQETRAELSRMITSLKKENENYCEEINYLQQQIKNLQNEASAKEEQTREREENSQKRINNLESRVEVLQKQLQAKRRELHRVQSQKTLLTTSAQIAIPENPSSDNGEHELESPSGTGAQAPVTQWDVHTGTVCDNDENKQGSSRRRRRKRVKQNIKPLSWNYSYKLIPATTSISK